MFQKKEMKVLEEAQKRTLLSNTLASLARAGVPAGGFRVVHEEEKKEERAYVMGRGEEKGVCYVNANERVEAMASVLEQQWRVKREASPKVMVRSAVPAKAYWPICVTAAGMLMLSIAELRKS